uniref:Uncharacterized protein n=1 Tax=Timema monikensis TaxID=170555 RepID=A0A7R9HI67_9NEOP|nr:unnamed protein product [Timema monikensis]
MNKHSRRWTYDIKRVQAIASFVCGHYCCLYAVAKAAGWRVRGLTDLFSTTNLCNNDQLAVTLFKRHFGNRPRCTRRVAQTCVPALDIKGWTFIPLREDYKCPFVYLINSAPWYVRNETLHRDLDMPTIKDHFRKMAQSFYARLPGATNPLIQGLGNYVIDPGRCHRRPKALLG